jgi:amino acid permease
LFSCYVFITIHKTGVAAFGNAPSAVIPAVVLIACIGTMSAYCFSLIGRVCYLTGATTYRDAWNKSVGESSSLIPAVSVTLKTMCAVLAYSMILADTFTSLFATVGMATTMTRTRSLLALTCGILLPLCWLKNLSSLAPFSLLGSLGMAYTAIAMAVRYFQKAYRHVGSSSSSGGGGALFVVAAESTPSFGTVGMEGALSPNVFILICMLSTAFMAHFNAPKFYTELKNNTVERYNKVVYVSFAIAIFLFASITSVGYLTFGAATDGLILNNYSTNDVLMNVSRVAVAISLVFS